MDRITTLTLASILTSTALVAAKAPNGWGSIEQAAARDGKTILSTKGTAQR